MVNLVLLAFGVDIWYIFMIYPAFLEITTAKINTTYTFYRNLNNTASLV